MLQLEANTKERTPAAFACRASSTLARKLNRVRDLLERLAHGSFEIAARCTIASDAAQDLRLRVPHVGEILKVDPAPRAGNSAAVRQCAK